MATRNIVPRANGEGSIGTAAKHWGAGHFDTLPNWQEYLAESTGYGVVSGCEPTISGLTVTVGAGIVHLADGTRKEIAATNITLDNDDAVNSRTDVIYIDGITAEVKKATINNLPENGIEICIVYIEPQAVTGFLTDKRDVLTRLQNVGTINVKDFGAKGDGVTDDTSAIQSCFNTGKKETIYFPTGDYLISDTITTSSEYPVNVLMDANARIFTETDNLEYLVRLGRWGTTLWEGYWIGGILDANDKAKGCLGTSNQGYFILENVRFKNFKEVGLHTNVNDLVCYNLRGSTLYFENTQLYNGSIAIANMNSDNTFRNISIKDAQIGIKLQQYATVERMDAWCSPPASSDFYKGSIFATFSNRIDNGYGAYESQFIDCCIDSYRRGFVQLNDYEAGVVTPHYTTRNIRYITDKNANDPNYPIIIYDVSNWARINDVGSTFNAGNGYVLYTDDNKYDINNMSFEGIQFYAPNDNIINALVDNTPNKLSQITGGLRNGNYLINANTAGAPTTNEGILNVTTRYSNEGTASYVKSSYNYHDLTTGEKFKTTCSGTDMSNMVMAPWVIDGAGQLNQNGDIGYIVIGNIVVEWGLVWDDSWGGEANTVVPVTWPKPVSRVLNAQATFLTNEPGNLGLNSRCQVGDLTGTGGKIVFINSQLDRCYWMMIGML
jgi:hypothetical protein